MAQAEDVKQTRKDGKHLRVPVLSDEAEAIREKAQRCGLSTASFLRNLGLGFLPESLAGPQAAAVLWRLQVDLARIVDLLGSCLDESSRLGPAERARISRAVPELLMELRDLQAALLAAARRL